MRLGRKRKSPTKRAHIPKRIRKTDENSAADALLLLSNTRIMKTHDCVVESSNEDGLARAKGSELSQQEKEPPCSSTVDCHKTVNDETQTTIETSHLSPYTDMSLKNKNNMRRALFVEVIMDPKKTCHYTGIFDI